MRLFSILVAPLFEIRLPGGRIRRIASAVPLAVLSADPVEVGQSMATVVVEPPVAVALVPGFVRRQDALPIGRIPVPHAVPGPCAHAVLVLLVPLSTKLALAGHVFWMSLSPPARRLAGFALSSLFLRLHSRAFIRNRSS